MQLSKDQVNTILTNGKAKGLDGKAILDGLVSRGYQLEGVDMTAAKAQIPQAKPADSTTPPADDGGYSLKDAGQDFLGIGKDIIAGAQKRADNIDATRTALQNGEQGNLRSIAQVAGQLLGGGADAIGAVFKGAVKLALPPSLETKVKDLATTVVQKAAAIPVNLPGKEPGEIDTKPIGEAISGWYNSLDDSHKRDVDAAGGAVNLLSNFLGGEGATAGAGAAKDAVAPIVDTALNTAKTAATDAIATAAKAKTGVVDAAKTGIDTVLSKGKNFVTDITSPSVPDAVKVSLNPTEALKGTAQDLIVSVKQDGQNVLKKLSELTPEERAGVQADTAKNLTEFTDQAKLFKNDRAVEGGSPVEIVGKRVDQALSVADKQRQTIGAKMGEIETKYLDQPLPVTDETLKNFSDIIDKFDNPKYGVDTGGAPVVRKLVSDFDTLEKSGATVGERLQFVRDWQGFLRDSKDAFGNFKDNASVLNRVEQSINKIRNETVDHIANADSEYRALRADYAKHVKLQDIGDSLLGKDGALGERIKGAATVKRAIQSNSDAGARQFLTELKNVTGYDAIKEGDVALTAMDNVGDYQGLSLLNILNDGKSGLVKKGLEKVRDVLVGDDAARAAKYVKK